MSTISVSGTTEVDFDEEVEICDLSDGELRDCVKEAQKRGLMNSDGVMPEREYLLEAYHELMGHRPANALALLERALWPSTAFKANLDVMNAVHKGKHAS